MGNYDAEIRVSTKVETSQMQKLQIRIDKAVDKVNTLTKKYDDLKNQKIPTQEYANLENKLKSAKDSLAALIAEEEKLSNAGVAIGAPWDNVIKKEADAQLGIEAIEAEMQKLVDTGKAFTIGRDSEEINKTVKELAQAKSELNMLVTKQEELGGKTAKVSDGLKKIGNASRSAFGAISREAGKSSSAFSLMRNSAGRAFSAVSNGARNSTGLLSAFSSRLKGLAASAFIFNLISKGFNAMVSSMRTGFTNLMGYSNGFANSIQSVKNSLSTLGNQIAAAFAPIVQAVIPWLNQLISLLSVAMSYVAQFIAALTGKSSYIRAKKVQDSYGASLGGTAKKEDDVADSANDMSDALDDTADSAKKARGALAAFDDLDVLEKQDKESDKAADKIKDLDDAIKDLGNSGAGGGGIGDLFEEVPIENSVLDAAEKLKEILAQLFAPLKEAWEREGKFVMKAWKYALEEIWKLIKDIGRDFLTVWNQEKTIQMLADLLHILGDVGLIIGNIAHALDEAWNKNQTGLHILENIRDIFAVIIHNIREAADYTVEWSRTLDFSPLLESIEHLTAALVPFADFVSGTLMDFYTQFLLPLASWTISENGIPRLINILGDFMDAVNWEALRTALKNLYSASEPYAEAIGEGLIDFIKKMKNMGVDILNALPVPIRKLADALASGDPEKVRQWTTALLEFIAAIEALKLAFNGFEKIGEIVATAKVGIEGLLGILQSLSPGMIGELGIKLGDLLTGSFLDPREWDNWIGDWANAVYNFLMDGADRLGEFLATTFSIENTLSWFDEAYENFKQGGIHILEGILDGFMGALILIPEIIVNFFEACWNELCNIFGIASPAKEMEPIGEYILLGIVEGFRAAFSYFTEVLTEWWENYVVPWFSAEKWAELGETVKLSLFETWTAIYETIVEKWTEIQEWFAEYWILFTESLMEIWENIVLFFTETWEQIQLLFNNFIEFLTTVFIVTWQTTWETAKNLYQIFRDVLTTITNAIKEMLSLFLKTVKLLVEGDWKGAWENAKNIFEAFKGKVSSVIDVIRGIIQSFFDWLMGIVSEAISAIESIGSAVKGIFGGGGGAGSGGGGGGGRSAAPAMTAYSARDFVAFTNDLPHLASGSVLRGGNPFMAILNEQPRGQTNVEAPLDTIKQAVREELSGMDFGGNASLTVPLYLDGEEFARLFLDDILSEMGRQGYDVDILGVT